MASARASHRRSSAGDQDPPSAAEFAAVPKRSRRTNAQVDTLLKVVETANRLERDVAALLKTADLTAPQFNVLRILRGAGPEGATCGQVGDRLIRHDPDVTRLVDRLLRRGLVARDRDAKDRRIVRTRITRKGLDVLGQLDTPLDALHERQFGHLSDRQLSDLRDLAALLHARSEG